MFGIIEARDNQIKFHIWNEAFRAGSKTITRKDLLSEFQKQSIAPILENWLAELGIAQLQSITWQYRAPSDRINDSDSTYEDYWRSIIKFNCSQYCEDIYEVPLFWKKCLPGIAGVSGLPEITRTGVYDLVAHESAIAKIANSKNIPKRFILACMDNGIAVAAYSDNKIIDVNNALDGDGPMGLKRAGSLFSNDLISWTLNSGKELAELEKYITSESGWMAWQGRLEENEWECIVAYQTAKEIGGMRAILKNTFDGIILTGYLAQREHLVHEICSYFPSEAKVYIVPGIDVEAGLVALTLKAKDIRRVM
jgi:hypothetical protein